MNRLEEYRSLLLRSPQFRETVQPMLRVLPVYLQPASAGTGQWLDDDLSEEMEVDDSVPANAEFGVRLAGDSMSPALRTDKSYGLVKQKLRRMARSCCAY